MRFILPITLSLILLTFEISAHPLLAKWIPGDYLITDIMKIINQERRNFAKKFNIANMNKLEFDEALSAYADVLIKSCLQKEQLRAQKNYEIIPIMYGRFENREEMLHELKLISGRFFINPSQTRIGLSVIPLPANCRSMIAYEYNQIFVLGPGSKSIVKTGAPGSRCEDENRKINSDGLCVKNPWD